MLAISNKLDNVAYLYKLYTLITFAHYKNYSMKLSTKKSFYPLKEGKK